MTLKTSTSFITNNLQRVWSLGPHVDSLPSPLYEKICAFVVLCYSSNNPCGNTVLLHQSYLQAQSFKGKV